MKKAGIISHNNLIDQLPRAQIDSQTLRGRFYGFTPT